MHVLVNYDIWIITEWEAHSVLSNYYKSPEWAAHVCIFEKFHYYQFGIISISPKRLHFYYGTIDKWVPVQFYENLKENVPGVQAELCQRKIPHAFVLSSSEIVAEIVSKWINKSDISEWEKHLATFHQVRFLF